MSGRAIVGPDGRPLGGPRPGPGMMGAAPRMNDGAVLDPRRRVGASPVNPQYAGMLQQRQMGALLLPPALTDVGGNTSIFQMPAPLAHILCEAAQRILNGQKQVTITIKTPEDLEAEKKAAAAKEQAAKEPPPADDGTVAS